MDRISENTKMLTPNMSRIILKSCKTGTVIVQSCNNRCSHVRTGTVIVQSCNNRCMQSVFVVINLHTTGTGILCEFHFILEFCDPLVRRF